MEIPATLLELFWEPTAVSDTGCNDDSPRRRVAFLRLADEKAEAQRG